MDGFYQSIITALAALLFGGLISILTARTARQVLGRLAQRTKSESDDFVVGVFVNAIRPLGFVISASLAWKILPIGEEIDSFVLGLIKLICIALIVRVINRIMLYLIQRWAKHINDSAVSTMLSSLTPMFRALVWCIGIAFYLQNIGVQMAAIWALLSAGGIGAGLALKEPVQEFFEYITILLDKPFQSGQFINIEGIWATVERVGVRSTRLKSLNGEIIIMSNSRLTNGIISNYAEMKNRRLVHRLGVVYDTKYNQMKSIPNIIKSIIDSTEDSSFDRCHFVEFGNFSLDFEFVYYIPTNNYQRAMAAQEKINLEIMRNFEKEGIEFAFPTQTINLVESPSR